MNDEHSSLKSGDSVRIKHGMFTGHTGEVVDVMTMQSGSGFYILVWVKLGGGRVDGFNPENLEKVRGFHKHQAA